MKILISGGTGFVGYHLARALCARGDQLTLLSSRARSTLPEGENLRLVQADTSQAGPWQQEVAGQDAIINLAGRTIFHYWSPAYKDAILSSRVLTTRHLVSALPQGQQTVLLSASAAGYYGARGDTELNESAPAGRGFLAEVCKAWEQEALQAEGKGARVALMRFGVVLGRDGGALATMRRPYLLGCGGPLGGGRQFFPWIHLDDLVDAILFLLSRPDLRGPFNMVAPEAVRQGDFARILGRVLHRPALLPVPSLLMKGILGDFGASLLQGQYVQPEALLQGGFHFRFPRLEEALRDLEKRA